MVKRQETGTEAEDNNERGPWQTLATLHSLRVCVSIRGNDSHQGSAAHNRVQAGVHYTSRTHTHVPAGLQYLYQTSCVFCLWRTTAHTAQAMKTEPRAEFLLKTSPAGSMSYEPSHETPGQDLCSYTLSLSLATLFCLSRFSLRFVSLLCIKHQISWLHSTNSYPFCEEKCHFLCFIFSLPPSVGGWEESLLWRKRV